MNNESLRLTLFFVFLLRDLFNAAFVSCWSELNEDQQDELIRSIELALTSQDIAEVTQTLLNLAEFMEHSDKVEMLLVNSFLTLASLLMSSLWKGCIEFMHTFFVILILLFMYVLLPRVHYLWEMIMALSSWGKELQNVEHMPRPFTTRSWNFKRVPHRPS